MSKQTFLSRYMLIIAVLERGPATFEQINDYLKRASELEGVDYTLSLRTFQRDIKDIYYQIGYEIANEKKGDKRYLIKDRPETMEYKQRLLESYQMINVIKVSSNYSDHIFFENRKAKGLEHFPGLSSAINNKKILEFEYHKYWEDVRKNRIVHPLALKEAQGRWYLIAIDTNDEKLKTFGLDRMDNIDVNKASFKKNYTYNIKALFEHSFGIVNDEKEKAHSIVLLFTYEQGQYVKNYPLHHSQKILKEDDSHVSLGLYIFITYDFIMELLSFGEEMKVISPVSLRNKLQRIYKNASEQYK